MLQLLTEDSIFAYDQTVQMDWKGNNFQNIEKNIEEISLKYNECSVKGVLSKNSLSSQVYEIIDMMQYIGVKIISK